MHLMVGQAPEKKMKNKMRTGELQVEVQYDMPVKDRKIDDDKSACPLLTLTTMIIERTSAANGVIQDISVYHGISKD